MGDNEAAVQSAAKQKRGAIRIERVGSLRKERSGEYEKQKKCQVANVLFSFINRWIQFY